MRPVIFSIIALFAVLGGAGFAAADQDPNTLVKASGINCDIHFISWPNSPTYAGTEVEFVGQLTCGAEGPTGKTIYLMEDDPFSPDETLAVTTTGADGHFVIMWIAEAQVFERELEIYASFDGDDDYGYARSDNLEVNVVKYGGSLTLDDFPVELEEGEVITFTGNLQIDQHSSEGAAVYIKDEDTLGPDDLLATAYVDADGSFAAEWIVRYQDTDDPVIEIYAVFEGNDTLGRLTTCDDDYTSPLGGFCLDTIDVTILDGNLPPGVPGYGEYIELYYSFDFDKSPHVAIVPSPDSYDSVRQHIIPAQEGVLMWTGKMEALYGGNWDVTFEVVEPGMMFAQKPDIIMNLETHGDNPKCGVDYSGVAHVTGIKPIQTVVCAESSDVPATAAHEFIHAMGLGHVFNKPRDMMCSVENNVPTCPSSFFPKETTPSLLSLEGVAALYGQDGYIDPNANIERGERFSQDRGVYSDASLDLASLEARVSALEIQLNTINTTLTAILDRLTALETGVSTPMPEPPQSSTTVTIEPVAGSGTIGCQDEDGCYIPMVATVDVGGVVIFSNTDTAAHTFTAGTTEGGPTGEFDSGLALAGTSFEWKPETPGEYEHFCLVHPWMTGLIIVQPQETAIGIGGTVFTDSNGNGVIDTGESGIPNRTILVINLSDPSDVKRLTTDSNGDYSIELDAGSGWLVQVEETLVYSYVTVQSDSQTIINLGL